MRLYTIMHNDKEQVAVDIDEKLMTLDSLGINVADMNELIIINPVYSSDYRLIHSLIVD